MEIRVLSAVEARTIYAVDDLGSVIVRLALNGQPQVIDVCAHFNRGRMTAIGSGVAGLSGISV